MDKYAEWELDVMDRIADDTKDTRDLLSVPPLYIKCDSKDSP